MGRKVTYLVLLVLVAAHLAVAAPIRTTELTRTEQEEIKNRSEEILQPERNQYQVYESAGRLVALNHVKAAERLVEVSKAASLTAKRAIIALLGDKRDSGVVENIASYWPILDLGVGSGDSGLVAETVRVLTKLECPEVSQQLLAILKNSQAAKEKQQDATSALSKFRILSMQTIGVLIEALDYIGDEKARLSIIETLNKRTFEKLMTKEEWRNWFEANRQKSWDEIQQEISVRRGNALREMEEKLEATRLILVQRTIELLKALAHDQKQQIAKCLELVQKEDEEPEVRAWCAVRLSELKVNEAVGPLAAALSSRSQTIRLAAIKALGEIADPSSLEPLTQKFASESPIERAAVASALAKLQIPQSSAFLAERLKEEKDIPALLAMVNAIGDLGYEEASGALSALVVTSQDGSPLLKEAQVVEIRRGVILALKKLFSPQRKGAATPELKDSAVRTLCALLADRDDSVRYQAADSLGELKADSAVEKLCLLFESEPNPGVAAAAAKALGDIGEPYEKILKSLCLRRKDPSVEVRKAVVFSLRQILGLSGAAALKPTSVLGVTQELFSEEAYAIVKELHVGIPDAKKLESLQPEERDKFYESRAILARSYVKLKEFKPAIAELELVLANLPAKSASTELREALAEAYGSDFQFSKAIENYDALLKSGIPSEKADDIWAKKKDLIEKLYSRDILEAQRQIEASLSPDFSPKPPVAVRKRLEELQKEIQDRLPREKTP